MPAPDPHGVWLDDNPSDRLSINADTFLESNPRSRKARARAILRNLQRGGWRCLCCREPVPLYRRADARFCCEQCRKRSARPRRAVSVESWGGHQSTGDPAVR